MNLLSLLLSSLLTDSSVSALAKKTGLSATALKKLIPLAVPLLLKFLTSNASSESGALSLLGALSQHTNQKALSDQIDEADTEDEKPLPCPCCSGESKLCTDRASGGGQVRCTVCGLSTLIEHSPAEAIAKWNRRAK